MNPAIPQALNLSLTADLWRDKSICEPWKSLEAQSSEAILYIDEAALAAIRELNNSNSEENCVWMRGFSRRRFEPSW
jgi:hypothetical protein